MESTITTYSLRVIRAERLPVFPGGLRAYVQIRGGISADTQIRQQGRDPKWNQEFTISVVKDQPLMLSLRIMHKKSTYLPSILDPCLGAIEIGIRELQEAVESEISLALRNPNGNDDGQDRGSIIIQLLLLAATVQVRRCDFTVLADGVDGKGGPIVDIVLVHGFGGHPKGAWTEEVHKPGAGNDKAEVFWPNDLLPEKFPNARILTYGYDTDVAHLFSRMSRTNISRLATNMLSALEGERRNDPMRPIIFIAHSLGGLVVKDAIQKSKSAGEYQKHLEPVYKSTRAIVFFGTPHRGTNWVALSKAVHTLTLRRVDTGVLDALDPDSETLDRITKGFAIMLKDNAFQIHSFYETKDITGVPGLSGKIVEHTSATIGDASEVEEGIDDDHTGMCKFSGKDDRKFHQLFRAVERFTNDIARTVKSGTVTNAPMGILSKHFTGRDKDVAFLQDALSKVQNGIPSCCGVYGMHGLGKSQLVLQYINISLNHRYSYVFWISANDVDKLSHGLTNVLDLVAHPDRYLQEQSAKLISTRRWLEEPHGDWLLVFDNVDNIDGGTLGFFRTYLPLTNMRGNTIFTTRTASVAEALATITGNQHSILQLRPLELRDTTDLFLKDAGVNMQTVTPSLLSRAEELVRYVALLPLAVVQAGAFMKQTGTTLDEMCELYKGDEKIDVIEWENDLTPYQERSVATAFTKQFTRLKEESVDTSNLLKVLSFLDPENIPVAMITEGAKEWLHPQYPPKDTTSQPEHDYHIYLEFRSLVTLICSTAKFRTALQKLRALSLVEYRSTELNSSLWIHDLIRFVRHEGAKKEDSYREWLRSSVSLVCGAFRQIEDPRSPKCWPECEEFMPHLRSLSRWSNEYGTNLELVDANRRIATYLRSRGRYGDAELLLKQVLEAYETKLGRAHPSTQISADNLADVYESQGRHNEAEALYKRVLAGYEEHLGADHPDTLTAVNNLGFVYISQGRYDEAEALFKRAVAGKEEYLGADHPDTLRSVNNLAGVYKSQGRYDEAESFFKRALTGREQHLGTDHPSTLTSVNNLADVYMMQGRYDEAEALYKQALAGREEHLGVDHPDTLTSVNNLAGIYMKQGRYDEAETLFTRAYAGREEHLGIDHPDTLASANNLAGIYESQERYDKAESLYKQAVAGFEKTVGPQHPKTKATTENLARLYLLQGRRDKVGSIMQRYSLPSQDG